MLYDAGESKTGGEEGECQFSAFFFFNLLHFPCAGSPSARSWHVLTETISWLSNLQGFDSVGIVNPLITQRRPVTAAPRVLFQPVCRPEVMPDSTRLCQ